MLADLFLDQLSKASSLISILFALSEPPSRLEVVAVIETGIFSCSSFFLDEGGENKLTNSCSVILGEEPTASRTTPVDCSSSSTTCWLTSIFFVRGLKERVLPNWQASHSSRRAATSSESTCPFEASCVSSCCCNCCCFRSGVPVATTSYDGGGEGEFETLVEVSRLRDLSDLQPSFPEVLVLTLAMELTELDRERIRKSLRLDSEGGRGILRSCSFK
mmetsp:Transcript_7196/g.12092  ORF Transcript_7196/g.12092 Transcript_7196/m.12092 type:complete len:218 (+) Transcript_7196:3306-3959(+)